MNTEQVAFQIISSSGDAFGLLIEGLNYAKENNFKETDRCIKEAREALKVAHNVQTELLTSEANGKKIELSLLFIHAQDHLMNVILAETLITEMICMYR
ncbi:PTS lactose/cellobiose transporter subunit IIA [Clostridium sp. AL.422]|uniref:PTS lactose/cellobiose transporter subunit IIA n=1 Tax=Clostridium TaxID=1485 RepID=UPI00293DF0F9|nr:MULTISPECIES: PTS lactose/cellobiose transporter subunit IIA [unclassified Clostridium]MDV4151376.1 PTS lactose/cellobiose transporter subunit IIA [Clostridium sp. AL.422]